MLVCSLCIILFLLQALFSCIYYNFMYYSHMDLQKTRTELIDWLGSKKGRWPVVAEDTGLSYHWVQKFAMGKIPNPGMKNLQILFDYKRTKK